MNKHQKRFADFAHHSLMDSPTTARDLAVKYREAGYVPPTVMEAVSVLKRMPEARITEPRNVGRSAVWSIVAEHQNEGEIGSSSDEPTQEGTF